MVDENKRKIDYELSIKQRPNDEKQINKQLKRQWRR